MNFCQRCHASNPDLATQCGRCGAALLPPLVPNHLKEEVSFLLDDEELGRISSLEFNLKSSERNFEELVGYLEKQALTNYHLVLTVEKLIEALDRAGVVSRKKLERRVRQNLRDQLFSFEQRQELAGRKQAILECSADSGRDRLHQLVERAIPLLYTARHQDGLRSLRQALRLDPGNRALLQVLAEISFIIGNYTVAGRYLDRLTAVAPENVPARLLGSLIHLKKGRYPVAQECLETARANAPDSFAVHFLLGVVHFLRCDYQSAGDVFDQAYRVRPLPQVSLLRSMAFYAGEHTPPSRILPRGAGAQPVNTGFFHFLSGLIWLRAKRPGKAENHFKSAVRCNPRWGPVVQQMRELDPESSRRTQLKIFTSHLNREMEGLMGVLIAEIQNYHS